MSKKVLAFLTAVGLCLSMSACGNSDSSDKSAKSADEMTEEDFEKNLEALDKQERAKASEKKEEEAETEDSSSEAEPEPEPITFEAGEEILNADFDSGLVQIGDDVFRNGGFMTVGEFAEKYGDKYVVMRHDMIGGGYDYYDILDPECDFLLKEDDEEFILCRKDIFEKQEIQEEDSGAKQVSKGTSDFFMVQLTLTLPRDKEKVAVKDAVIFEFKAGSYDRNDVFSQYTFKPLCINSEYAFYPKNCMNAGSKFIDEAKDLTLDDAPKYLESQGLKQTEQNVLGQKYKKSGGYFPADGFTDIELYYTSKDENLCGGTPIYKYKLTFNSSTEKFADFRLFDMFWTDAEKLED